MTDDSFLDELRADWRSQMVDLERIRALTARRGRWLRFIGMWKLVATMLALLFAMGFAWLAFAVGYAVFALGAVAMLVAVPLLLFEYLETRRGLMTGRDNTPAGVVRTACHQVETARRLLWTARMGALLLACCAVAVVGLFTAGAASRGDVALLTPLWGGTALCMWGWQAWRGYRLAAEAELCRRLLAEYRDTDDA